MYFINNKELDFKGGELSKYFMYFKISIALIQGQIQMVIPLILTLYSNYKTPFFHAYLLQINLINNPRTKTVSQ